LRCWQNADGCKARDEGRSLDYDTEEGPRSVAPAKLCSGAGRKLAGLRLRGPALTFAVARTELHASASTTQSPHFAAIWRDGAFRAICFVARLAKGTTLGCASLRASHPGKPPSQSRGT